MNYLFPKKSRNKHLEKLFLGIIKEKGFVMKNIWLNIDEKERGLVFDFCEDYKKFLSKNKTERECVFSFVEMAKKNGFKELKKIYENKEKLHRGDKVYIEHMNKMVVFFVVGEEEIENGVNLIASHLDSPRIDLKTSPIFEEEGFCFFDTHYYGGIKKYHWLTLPLALHGVLFKKNGEKILINIGEEFDEPVFVITDILPHLSKDIKIEKLDGEMLDVLIASIPLQCKEGKIKGVKENLLNILKDKNILEEDFVSAEIEIVPAGKARDLGFDKSMILGYGHDDRICAYTSFHALLDLKTPCKRTSVCLMVDKEEVGSEGATGAMSCFVENSFAFLCECLGKKGFLSHKKCLANSLAFSADVTAGFDPLYPSPTLKRSSANLGFGLAFQKYGGSFGKNESNDSNPEFIAKIRKIFDENKIFYSFNELGKVDCGGGATIAGLLAKHGMEVVDCGVPLLSMHSPWEVVSKVDVFESFKGYKIFFKMTNSF